MCQLLDIPRSSLYYHLKNDSQKKKHDDSDLINLIKEIFKNSRNNCGKWNYICLMLDLYNREIVGYAASKNKNARLVEKALYSIKYDLRKIDLFHSDRGNEFKNEDIEKALKTFNINRSLSAKGCQYDNAVAEATYKIIKTEFAFNKRFESLEELELELFDYVNWYNNVRIHGSLGYKTPVKFRMFS